MFIMHNEVILITHVRDILLAIIYFKTLEF